jgi:hypothetical protein
MSGSKNMSYDSSNLTTPDIKWLGVRPSDLDRCGLKSRVARRKTRRLTRLSQVQHPAAVPPAHDGGRYTDGEAAAAGGLYQIQPEVRVSCCTAASNT